MAKDREMRQSRPQDKVGVKAKVRIFEFNEYLNRFDRNPRRRHLRGHFV
jgi:hypothetical protein